MSNSHEALATLVAISKGQAAIAAAAFTVLSDPPPKNFTIKVILSSQVKHLASNDTTADMSNSHEALATLVAISKGQAAIAAAAFTVLSDPPPGINYTLAVSTQPYCFMIARPRELSRALLFLLPFTTDVSINILGSIY
uniref:Ionotropic receptor n=1 Tax=Leucinodes orbonalis TaxID=711050 RepID=A0AAU0QK17_9NEOP|nr:ionotropic receptor [Leucinodes orbonalis]